MNVVVVGDVCVDRNISENASYSSYGSPSVFMSRIFSKFTDVTTTIISHYGADFSPTLINTLMYPPQANSKNTLIYENHMKKGVRQQKVYNADNFQTVTINDELKHIISNADIVVLAPLLPYYSAEYVKKILSFTKNTALKLLLPQGFFRKIETNHTINPRIFIEDHTIIPLFDFIILSEEDRADIDTVIKKWLDWSSLKIIVTMSNKGGRFVSRNDSFEVPTKPISNTQVVDSVGAGDIFAAGFMYQYFHSKNIQKSIEFANYIAGQSLKFTPDQLESANFKMD